MVIWGIDPRSPKLLSLGRAYTSKAPCFQHWATMLSDMFSLEIEKLLTSLGSGPSIYYSCSSPSCFVCKIKLLPLLFALLPHTLLPCWFLLVLGVVRLRSRCLKCSCRILPPSSRWMSSHFLQDSPKNVCVQVPDSWVWFLHTVFLKSHINTLPNTHAGPPHPWYLYCVFELFIAPWLIVLVSWGDVPFKGCSDVEYTFLS